MPRAKAKAKQLRVPKSVPAPTATRTSAAPSGAIPNGDVFTLAEAAAYLRLPEATVMQLVRDQGLPCRRTGAEWRFLKAAIQEWLKTPSPPLSSKDALLAMAGQFKDDPDLEEIVREAYRRRGRPITEDGE